MSSEVVSGQSYRITNVKAGNALDLSGVDNRSSTFSRCPFGSFTEPLHIVIGYPYHGGMNQQWTFNWEGDAWSIRSVSSSKYLGIDGNPNNGTKLVADTQMFKWHIWRDAMDENNFRSVENVLVLRRRHKTPRFHFTLLLLLPNYFSRPY